MASVSQVSVWSPNPGKVEAFIGQVGTAKAIHERMGATVNVAQTVAGGTAMSVVYMMTFESGAAYGAFMDGLAGDADWQAFWMGALADPTATQVSTALYSAIDI